MHYFSAPPIEPKFLYTLAERGRKSGGGFGRLRGRSFTFSKFPALRLQPLHYVGNVNLTFNAKCASLFRPFKSGPCRFIGGKANDLQEYIIAAVIYTVTRISSN